MRADHSISGTAASVVQEVTQALPARVSALASSADGCLALVHHRFPASEGAMGHPTQLRLALALKGGGHLQQHPLRGPRLDARWSVGQFNVVLPGQTGTYASPAVEVIGLAIDWRSMDETSIDVRALASLAGGLHRDDTVSALLAALGSAARNGLLSDDLLRSGSLAVVRRLGQLAQGTVPRPPSRPLSRAQLEALMRFIDACRDTRPDVSMMAGALGMDETRFRRGIQSATGMSPYQFLTHHRMHWARLELKRGRSVMQVAQSVGYANASKFSAAFRRVTGESPSASRR